MSYYCLKLLPLSNNRASPSTIRKMKLRTQKESPLYAKQSNYLSLDSIPLLVLFGVLLLVSSEATGISSGSPPSSSMAYWRQQHDINCTVCWCAFVLRLHEIELNFFTVANKGLCFGFVPRTVSVTQGCLLLLMLVPHQGLFCSSPCPASEQGGGVQEVGRGHSRDS